MRRPGGAADALARAAATLRRPAVLAMFDQAAVSGASFLTTVLIGRFADPQHLGIYSLGWSIALALMAVQMSLVTTPYAVHHHQPHVCPRAYAGSTVIMQLAMLAAVLAGLLVTCAIVPVAMRPAAWAMALAVPLLLLREFGRRMGYARLSVVTALAVDMPVVALQIAGLALLAAAGRLSAATAFLALGAAAATGAAVGAVALRRQIAFRRDALGADVRRSWAFGRWIAGAQVLGVLNTQGVFWLVAAVLGTVSTGVYAACLAIVLLCNPFMLAVGNILTPRAAETFARHGPIALRQLIARAATVLAIVMALFCAALFFGGDPLVQLLYGAEYAGHRTLIVLLGLTFLVGAVGMAINDGIRALGRADLEFTSTLLDSAITVGLGLLGLYWLGLVGLAWANLLGGVAALALQATAFRRLLRATPPAEATVNGSARAQEPA